MKKYFPYIGAVVALIVLVVLASFMVLRNQNRKMGKIYTENVQANGNDFINDEMVRKMIAKKIDYNKLTIGNLHTDSIESWLTRNQFVKNAQVYHTPKGELMVRFEQKNPIARVKNRNIQYYITDEFEKIPLSPIYSADVMLVSGDIEKSEYEDLVHLIQYIDADNLLKNNITGIKKERKNFFILSVNSGSYDVAIGNLENLDEKFTKLKCFYDQYLSKMGTDVYRRIDLSYKKQVVGVK